MTFPHGPGKTAEQDPQEKPFIEELVQDNSQLL
jgi:hypothetical protein